MSLVLCKCGCGKKIESSFAYSVKMNGVTFRFLDCNHYYDWKAKSKKSKNEEYGEEVEAVYDVFVNIIGSAAPIKDIIRKELANWEEVATFAQIIGYLKENIDMIVTLIRRKEIVAYPNIVKYVGACIINNAAKYKPEEIVTAGVNMQIIIEKKREENSQKKKKSLAELEDEI